MDLLKDIDQQAKEYTPPEEAIEETSTYTMLKMMGDKDPDSTIKKHKDATKKSIKDIMKKAKKKMGWK